MAEKSQLRSGFGYDVKVWLLQHGHTVTWLAQQIGRPRPSVSAAINRGIFPKIQSAILSKIRL